MTARLDRLSDSQGNAFAVHSLPRLAAWAVDRYRDDLPDALHARGTWTGPQQYGQEEVVKVDGPEHVEYRAVRGAPGKPRWPSELVGGSHLGAPRLDDAFRRYLEDSPYQVGYAEYDNMTQRDPHYVRPFAANLARLRGSHPLLARRVFFLVACCGGDTGFQFGPAAREEQEILYREGLRLLYDGWRSDPPGRVLPRKVA